ncbi:hypothetical protein KAJ27_01815 [bacterium]|nr:hypothetical protein [bacterium]
MKKSLLLFMILFFAVVSVYPKEILPLKYWLDKIKIKYSNTVDKLKSMDEADESCYDDEFISEKIHTKQKVSKLKGYMDHIKKKLKIKKKKEAAPVDKAKNKKTKDIRKMFFYDEVVPLVYTNNSESKQVLKDIERKNIDNSQAERALYNQNNDFYQIKDLVDDFRLLYKAGEAMNMIIDQIEIVRDMNLIDDKPLFTIREEDAIRHAWISFLCHRKALLIMIDKYRGKDFYKNDPKLNRKVMFLYYGAMITLFRNSLKIVNMAKKSDMIWDKLNEKDISWDIEKDQLQSMYKKLAQYKNRRVLKGIYNEYRETFADEIKGTGVKHWLHMRIENYIQYIQDNSLTIWTSKLSILWDSIKDLLDKPRYSVLSAVELWVGDNRYRNDAVGTGLDHDMIEQIKKKLQPGDFLVSRKNYYLSNIFLGGFWPHGILYVGTVNDLKKLGIADHPTIKKHLAEFSSPALDGNERLIIEAKSEGVKMESAEVAFHVDYLCAFSPQVSLEKRKQAIIDAFSHVGKDYDYDFDFFASDELACTEVLYRIYSSDISYPMINKMGKTVLIGNKIVEHWKNERSKKDKDYSFIFFLDQSKSKGVFFNSPDELAKTLDRAGTSSLLDDTQQAQKNNSIFW